MITYSSLGDLADMMITYDPGFFMLSAVELDPTRADGLFQNLPLTYHVTDYLNAILNYAPFGSSYYTNIVNQLIGLGHAAGNWEYSASEHLIYGSSRIGVHQTNLMTRGRYNQGDICITLEDVEYTSLYRGKRNYELSNHLGNVQVVVSDKRISVCDEELEVDYFKAEVLSAMDYYPFGMMMPDRQWYAGSDSGNYRYGFNGMEKNNEISGLGNSYTTEFRQYDPRLGRWLSNDPLTGKFPWMSPYTGMNNNPIVLTDPKGLEADIKSEAEKPGLSKKQDRQGKRFKRLKERMDRRAERKGWSIDKKMYELGKRACKSWYGSKSGVLRDNINKMGDGNKDLGYTWDYDLSRSILYQGYMNYEYALPSPGLGEINYPLAAAGTSVTEPYALTLYNVNPNEIIYIEGTTYGGFQMQVYVNGEFAAQFEPAPQPPWRGNDVNAKHPPVISQPVGIRLNAGATTTATVHITVILVVTAAGSNCHRTMYESSHLYSPKSGQKEIGWTYGEVRIVRFLPGAGLQ